jgi:CO dehydrogenase maturation factor
MTTIAFTGKGGVGKTTIAALALQWLVTHGRTPVLAIDADSNANLHELLGITFPATVGGIREEARSAVKGDPAHSKREHLSMLVQKALVEQNGFDFLVMGRPEGPGCYCYANNVLRDSIAQLSSSYPYLVIDCEAGLEHVSRRTLLSIDWLVTVSDQSFRGLRTAVRIDKLLEEMKTRITHRVLIINRASRNKALVTPEQSTVLADGDFEWIMALPEDPEVAQMDAKGGTIHDVPQASFIKKAIDGLMDRMIHEDEHLR